MTKADIITKISRQKLIEEPIVSQVLESFMATVKDLLDQKENVHQKDLAALW